MPCCVSPLVVHTGKGYDFWEEEEGLMTRVLVGGKERWSSCMDDEIDQALSDVDESEPPDLGDEWRTWQMDDPELESDVADEGVKKNHWKEGETCRRILLTVNG